ncbi:MULTISPECIES: endolytic transglycosylase MltG [unclassified Streptomyces]|uniref:endolytic transglycosylase MltG n=1 Tax=unclassified Streptomyces TaxID=2593676 RepID=UPI002259F5F3|nr:MULTISPECIES: endolytic transglycosylase MltG [unclassified Streptomyces]WSP53776.1 endolytic transglycosylase MltG [Streptomyces sp. NBC_01241]WSU25555.1 endolytic transglycosylase MltG [Streptomyces sp. NBC_01108]MCX4785180.1 endolytic transglycosylase MltG [Streptomyces sp. NBC_01221]MCX4798879.1 endolytic transglycosylase MltG [Streptomyces sp. NBC_01242]WSJ40080.1 endolytic transglycosylase MltG [Streptomyces sp. NBC_01321]
MVNQPPDTPPGRARRPTRCGRLVLLIGFVLVLAVAAAVLVPLLLRGPKVERVHPLVVPEGRRASQVYAAVDKTLAVAPGTTEKAVGTADLPLPAAAKGNPEGYLFPATYPITSDTTPQSLLRYMADTAVERFGADHITAGARRNGVSGYQTVTIASIVQAEADTERDMGKVARVIYNRLDRGMPLQMDSTLNYALNRSTLHTTTGDTKIDSPYNSYERKGLPPTPIGNPGEQAMVAAITPTPGPWLYFVTVAPGDTRFTSSYTEQQRNVEEFNRRHRSASGG